MTFRSFWPQYLRAHSLPGTRALHYFATAIGLMAGIETLVTQKPWIFVVGIALSYGIAVGAHWFIERNQPLIRVSAFLGAVADLRMCWLAVCGKLGEELTKNNDYNEFRSEMLPVSSLRIVGKTKAVPPRFPPGRSIRFILLAISAAGLALGLLDLGDLFEFQAGMHYPIIQLGLPIVAFGAAFGIGATAIAMPRLASRPRVAGGVAMLINRESGSISVNEASLWRAFLALLAFGAFSVALAELAEHGVANAAQLYISAGALVGLIGMSTYLARQVWCVTTDTTTETTIIGGLPAGPQTLGVRVDGRVDWVDVLENCLSLGKRRAIVAATLEAAAIGPGQRLVDVGCGTGELAIMAAPIIAGTPLHCPGEIIGIDATPGMIYRARQRALECGVTVRFDVAVAENMPFSDSIVDAVTSSFFFHHLPTGVKRQALREMWRVLAPGGRLIITDYGWARSVPGLIASLPMRFNFHEFVRGQLNGELEYLIDLEGLGKPEVMRIFLGYISVLKLVKPAGADVRARSPASETR